MLCQLTGSECQIQKGSLTKFLWGKLTYLFGSFLKMTTTSQQLLHYYQNYKQNKRIKYLSLFTKMFRQNKRKKRLEGFFLFNLKIKNQGVQYKLKMNLKCLLYARYTSSIPINSIVKDTSNKQLKADLDRMPSKIKALKSREGERNKLRTQYGVWHIIHDGNDICYALCTSDTYPERHAFGLIQKLQQKIAQISHAEFETEENIKSHSKKYATQLMESYNDLSKVDKVARAQGQVDGLKDEIGSGIKKLMGNQQSLNTMNEKAQKMKNFAGEFEKNSQTLERMLYWRNCKIKVIVGLCIVGLLGFVILIIVQKSNSTN